MKRIAIIVGTRPEIIKVAPIYLQQSSKFSFEIIATGQHSEMADLAFSDFGIKPNINLDLMQENQSALGFLSNCLSSLEQIFKSTKYDGVIVQGDTSSALAGALSAFHHKIPIAHLEAGLRTYDKYSPFPEELNRNLISKLSDIHFCPTQKAKNNLEREGFNNNVYLTGNSVVDAVKITQNKILNKQIVINNSINILSNKFSSIVFVTGHRRENFDLLKQNLCQSLIQIRDDNPNTIIIFPVHLNPNVQEAVYASLSKQQRIFLTSPLDYASTLHLMSLSDLIITDSGGIQEEAPCFGTMVLVTRNTTERSEAIDAGFAKLCALDQPNKIVEAANEIIRNKTRLNPELNPFGRGDTAKSVIKIIEELW